MKRILALSLLCPLTVFAADWSYDGQSGAMPASASMEKPAAMMTSPAGPAPAAAPRGGVTMSRVRSAHGDPQTEWGAVGEPPITRWQYPGYVVYFENDRVITSVGGRW